MIERYRWSHWALINDEYKEGIGEEVKGSYGYGERGASGIGMIKWLAHLDSRFFFYLQKDHFGL